jgi:hypothetical protein
MSDIDPKVGEALKSCGIGPEGAWKHKQSGKWIVAHWALERVSASKGITYDEPKFLVAEREAAAVLVTGRLGEKSEWSVGEACINLNYTVNPKQPGYPFAMAEKRAKDRVILKLIGLHGHAYSEEEADDFKKSSQHQQSSEPTTTENNPFEEKQLTPAEIKFKEIGTSMSAATTSDDLERIWLENAHHVAAIPEKGRLRLNNHYFDCRKKFTEQKEVA